MMNKIQLCGIFALFLAYLQINGQNLAHPTFSKNPVDLGQYVEILEDSSGQLLAKEVFTSVNFKESTTKVPHLGLSTSAFWIRFTIKNHSEEEKFLVELAQPTMDEVVFFPNPSKNLQDSVVMAEYLPFNNRKYKEPNYLFDVALKKGETKSFLMRVKSKENIQLPLTFGKADHIFNKIKYKDIFTGLYIGCILAMIFYNLFIYFVVRDKNYLYYVVYVLLVLITQICIQGYPFQLLWPNYPWLQTHSLFLFPSLVGFAFIEFSKSFLQMKKYTPLLYKGANVFHLTYLICIISAILGYYPFSFQLVDISAGGVSLFMLSAAIVISRKYRPAKFYLLAWSIFLVGVIVFVLKDFDVLPYNNYTRYTMQFGSAIEAMLLSFALADRINTLRREKEEAQRRELKERSEKQTLLQEQNIMLEKEVSAATLELRNKNIDLFEINKKLKITLSKLKQTQSQLVQAEKLASLGNMAAGIAHEINNPMNIISQCLDVVEQDVKDYDHILTQYQKVQTEAIDLKEQIMTIQSESDNMNFNMLLEEINESITDAREGVERTVKIAKELKTFSRIDQAGFSQCDIQAGIESVLDVHKLRYAGRINIITQFSPIPLILCDLQKLNLAFSNILENAIQAIDEKWGKENKGIIEIKLLKKGSDIQISFKDNGNGMSKSIRQKAFDPFFTTKEVGQGKGLGLSSAFGIISEHGGTITLNSVKGEWTSVEVYLPINPS